MAETIQSPHFSSFIRLQWDPDQVILTIRDDSVCLISLILLFVVYKAYTYSVDMKNAVYIVVPVDEAKVSEFEMFMRNHYEPYLLSGKHASVLHLILHEASVPQPATPSINEIADWYQTKYPDAHFAFLPNLKNQAPAGDFGDAAYSRAIVHIKTFFENANHPLKEEAVVFLSSTSTAFTFDLIKACHLRSQIVENKTTISNLVPQLYQPIPFTSYEDNTIKSDEDLTDETKLEFEEFPISQAKSEVGFWELTPYKLENEFSAPLFGRMCDVYQSARALLEALNSSNPELTFRKALYNRIYTGELSLLRTPDLHIANEPSR